MDEPVEQINRFCNLLFGANNISPSKFEYGMFMARAAALRTLDLSRQVGAAIFTEEGEIITLGSNEVPKAGGGTYWTNEPFDDHEWLRGFDSNHQRKKEILSEVAQILKKDFDPEFLIDDKALRDSQFMDALEYGRVIHAEMSAISDAARLGRSVKDGVLFCTTFPCHMCAKYIVSAGLKRVIFLEPYPKSLAADLHSDSISIEGSDRGKYDKFPKVEFAHFYGVSPRRYREMFGRTSRKNDDGTFQHWNGGKEQPYIDIKFPFYVELEKVLVEKYVKKYMDDIQMTTDHLDQHN
jgi:deoxycytidylate deaminase